MDAPYGDADYSHESSELDSQSDFGNETSGASSDEEEFVGCESRDASDDDHSGSEAGDAPADEEEVHAAAADKPAENGGDTAVCCSLCPEGDCRVL